MTCDRDELIQELLRRAASLPPDDRDEFLRVQCGNDRELCMKVLNLLGGQDEKVDILTDETLTESNCTTSDKNATDDQETTPKLPERIGKYRICNVIGAGGMGIVYLAAQEHPHRSVALKVLRRENVTDSAMRRFELESEILARLRHPNIAQIYEAGTHDEAGVGEAGVPYFAMEHIPHSVPLTEYANRNNLGIRERLAMFIKVCRAVQHGHQRGIIHRDLKPGNTLVDPTGEPKIIDFGLARLSGVDMAVTAHHTTAGQLLGTLQYMSPEQCSADPHDVDVRTDVYALGVILYELMCGQRPYEINQLTVLDAIRTIQGALPPRPSAINRALRGDIETIIIKALEKDRDRRYGSAADLADDIDRYLNSEPIAARPPSISYQMRMFARRHFATVAAGIAIVAVLVVAAIVSLIFAVRANRASQEAERQAAIAEAVNRFLNEDLLAAADPRVTPDRNVTLRETLDAASQRIAGRFDDDPLIEAEIRETITDTYNSLGEYQEALRHIQETLRIRQSILGEEHPDTLIAMGTAAALLVNLERYEEAEQRIRETLALKQRVLGVEDPSTLKTVDDLIIVLCNLGRYDEAEPLAVKNVDMRKRVMGEDSPELMVSFNNLANIYVEQGDFARAEPLSLQALESSRRIYGDKHPYTLAYMHSLAYVYRGQGRYDEAEPLLRSVVEAEERILGEDHPETLRSMVNLAELYQNMGRGDEAVPVYLRVLDLGARTMPEQGIVLLIARLNLAEIYLENGRLDQAEQHYSTALADAEESLPPGHPYLGVFLCGMGRCLSAMGEHVRAEKALIEAHGILEPTMGPANEQTVIAVRALSKLYEASGRVDEAERWRGKLPQ